MVAQTATATDDLVNRLPWDMPDSWWGSVPAWLYDLQAHMKAPWVGAFRYPRLTEHGWMYDVWEYAGRQSRWTIKNGIIVSAGSARHDRPYGTSWYHLDDAEACEGTDAQRTKLFNEIERFDEPTSWRLGMWGFVGRFGKGLVNGPFDMPQSAEDCSYEALSETIEAHIGFERQLIELALVSPDGQVRGSEGLAEALKALSGTNVCRVDEHLWWERVAGMTPWVNG